MRENIIIALNKNRAPVQGALGHISLVTAYVSDVISQITPLFVR